MLPTLPSLRQPEYQITNSLRFRSNAAAYLNELVSTPGNSRTSTWSGWVKRGTLTTSESTTFWAAGTSVGNNVALFFTASDQLGFTQNHTSVNTVYRVSNNVYRDPSAWYHIVFVLDTNNDTVQNRARIWVNGVEITSWATNTTIPSGTTFWWNANGVRHTIGSNYNGTPSQYFDGYLAEVHFVDGQALTPAAFGAISSRTGVWAPRKYLGTYGTNGVYLKFADNSETTAAAIGKDSSGNATPNNFTPTNVSLTPGVTYDSMIDVPTPYADGDRGRGNYAVLNPLLSAAATTTIGAGNLRYINTNPTISDQTAVDGWRTITKQYYECTASAVGASSVFVYAGDDHGFYCSNGQIFINRSLAATVATYTTGDVLGFAVTVGGEITFYKNNVVVYTSSGATAAGTPLCNGYNSTTWNFNFGQRPFNTANGQPPAGFKTLNTYNLPEPAIVHGHAYMTATTYTGTGVGRNISNFSNNRSFQPDLVWIKSRSSTYDNALYDASCGATTEFTTNSATAATTQSTGLTAFNQNGFGIGTSSKLNANGVPYVAWQWKENITAGLDIVRYTGTGVNRTVAHNLGSMPGMIIVKRIDDATQWQVRHVSVDPNNRLKLNSSDLAAAAPTVWNNTLPDANNFTVGTHADVNASGGSYVAYCFKPVVGFSAFSSYTGNGSTNGPFIYCGFRPKWVMYKILDVGASGNWQIYDTARDTYNPFDENLTASAAIMSTNGPYIDVLSNGFKLRTISPAHNTSTADFLFAAFAEVPFKYALAR